VTPCYFDDSSFVFVAVVSTAVRFKHARIEYSARLPLPIGERVGVRGFEPIEPKVMSPLTRPPRFAALSFGGRPLPAGERWSKPRRFESPTGNSSMMTVRH